MADEDLNHNQDCTSRTFTPSGAEAGLRLDKFLAIHLDCSRSKIQTLIKEGRVTLNEEPILEAKYSVREGEDYKVGALPVVDVDVQSYEFPLHILYEDDCLLVINKPAGLVVHPGAGNYDNTLVNALVFH